ncbi:hypothetical protein JOF56_003660 [Kibdelosporangium banguiense]|uniref:FtsX extracellular domain-containing protein n=1 Tax=Kibdelosporangium banguiense TaxID=1365924 RepID=A0ABS4TFT5_9PSEU|nr:hypothetical protein [Kibdelosporangium banguiense]MBP2323275.1 hypothetical protein [Kibdelosporangium banguiense]
MLLIGGLVAVVAGAIAALLLFRSGPDSAESRGPMPLGDHQPCTDQVLLYFREDVEMTRAAAMLANDTQIAKIYTETTQEADDRFRRVFDFRPDILETTPKGLMGAILHVAPASQVGTRDLADRLRNQFPEARQVGRGQTVRSRWSGSPATGTGRHVR